MLASRRLGLCNWEEIIGFRPPLLLASSIMEDIGNENPGLPGDEARHFAELMDEVRLGSHEAAEELWRRYGPYVVHVVRRSLHHRLRARFDSQDFAQAAWASFFAELPRAERLDT